MRSWLGFREAFPGQLRRSFDRRIRKAAEGSALAHFPSPLRSPESSAVRVQVVPEAVPAHGDCRQRCVCELKVRLCCFTVISLALKFYPTSCHSYAIYSWNEIMMTMIPVVRSAFRGGRIVNGSRTGIAALHEVVLLLVVASGVITGVYHFMVTIGGKPTNSHRAEIRPIYNIAVDDDERTMWVSRLREDLLRIDLETGEILHWLPTSGMTVSAAAHSRDGSTSLVCGAERSVVLFREGLPTQVVEMADADSIDVAATDEGAVALATFNDGRIRVASWRGAVCQDFYCAANRCADVVGMCVNSTCHRLLVARNDGSASFYDLEDGRVDGEMLNIGPNAISVAWSQDESLVAVVTRDCQVRIYDVRARRLVRQGDLNVERRTIDKATMVISPDQRRLAVSILNDAVIALWDLATGTTVGKLNCHGAAIPTLQFSTDSERLFSGGYDGAIRVWSLKDYSQLRIVSESSR